MPKYPKKILAQLIVQQCVNHRIENVVISPGSRNAPLTLGFVNHAKIKARSIVDERSAGFFALGMAQQNKHPVALLCTSGSALLNYYPAVAEAYYSKIPLVIISADRPKHLIDIGDGQTIRQEGVFRNHILFEANLLEGADSEITSKEDNQFKENNEAIKKALDIAKKCKGPVHINIPMDEPLYETVNDLYDLDVSDAIEKKEASGSLIDETPIPVEKLQKFADSWNKSAKKMVVVGTNYPDELIQIQLSHLAKDPTVLILTETTSNISHPNFVNNIDQLLFPLNEDDYKALKPDILLTFGGMVVSKKVKQFLRSNPPKEHWHIDPDRAMDTYHCLTQHFDISPQLFFSQFFFLTIMGKGIYRDKWLQIRSDRKIRHQNYLNEVDYSDILVFDKILTSLPKNTHLQLSNSSVIRYTQLFDIPKGLKVFCNRGASGIDGSTSTAIGAATACDWQTVFITGDISFLYDSNALWNQYMPNNFRIVLINNGGGGIFRFIPGPKSSEALDYFETPHTLNASHLCAMYKIQYRSAGNQKSLEQELKTFYNESPEPVLLEVFTPAELNDVCLKNYFKSMKKF